MNKKELKKGFKFLIPSAHKSIKTTSEGTLGSKGEEYHLNATLFTSGALPNNVEKDLSNYQVSEEHSQKIVILCHGFPGDQYEHGRYPYMAEKLNAIGIDALTFDFSGFGDNKRYPVYFGDLLDDLVNVYQWACSKGYKRIGTIGLSMAGFITLAPKLTLRTCAVFWAPAFYLPEMVGKYGKKVFGLQLKLKKNKPLSFASAGENKDKVFLHSDFLNEMKNYEGIAAVRLKELKIPRLVLQGTWDVVVRKKLTKEAFDEMTDEGVKEIKYIKHAGHNFRGKKLEQFTDFSAEFFNKYL